MQQLLKKFEYKLDTIIKYGIAAILVAVPLYPKFPFLNVPGIYVSIRIEDFLILTVTAIWFVRNLPNFKKHWQNPIFKAMAIFLSVGFVSTLIGIVFLNTVSPVIGLFQWARRVEYLTGFVIAVTSVKSIKDTQFFLKCIGIVLILVFLFGFSQKYLGAPVITTQNSEYSKGIALRYVPGAQLVSTFAGHYDMATYIILTTPIFLALIFVNKKSLEEMFGNMNVKVVRGLIFVVVAVSFWLMINAANRISTVSYVLALTVTLMLLKKYKYIPLVILVTMIFTFSTSNLFNRYLNIFQVLKDRLLGLIPTAYAQEPVTVSTPVPIIEDRSTSIRLAVEWPRAIRAFLKNPLLGTGYSSTTLATDNDYLRTLGETGILGLISIFFVFFRIIKDLLTKSGFKIKNTLLFIKEKEKKEIDFRIAFLAGIIGAIPGVLLNATFLDVFEASKFAISFWFLVGMSIAILNFNNEKKNI